MHKEKKDRVSFRETVAYTCRGIAIWWKAAPELFVSAIVRQAVTALSPYLPLYFTARLVNAIAGNREEMWGMLAALLVSTVIMGVMQAAAKCWDDTMRYSRQEAELNRIFIEKLLSMDFCDVDDPKNQALLTEIIQLRNWGGYGLPKLYRVFSKTVGMVFRIIGALILSVSLFLLPVPASSTLAWLNHPLCLVAIMALLVLSSILSATFSNKAEAYWSNYDGTQGNRAFSYFYFIAMSERHRGTDIRAYAQDKYLEDAAKVEMDGESSFGPNSSVGRAGRGPMGMYAAGAQVVSQIFMGLIYLFAGLKALGGAFGIGSVTQYVGALAGLAEGLTELLSLIGDLRTNAAFLKPTYQFLDIPNHMYQGSLTTEKRADRKYEIEFRNVSFRYPGTEGWALRHVSVKFHVGERLAVVGENGSGKTTFIKLLCRLYDPTEGEILLNGIDIRKYRYDNYLALFSVVFQDFKLLAQPLGQNVAAAENYDRDRAEMCLRKAGFG